MTRRLPVMLEPAALDAILERVSESPPPARLDTAWLVALLGDAREGAPAFVPLARQLGWVDEDDRPTTVWPSPTVDRAHLAEQLAALYRPLYLHTDRAHELGDVDLLPLVGFALGIPAHHRVAHATADTFRVLARYAGEDAMNAVRRGGEPVGLVGAIGFLAVRVFGLAALVWLGDRAAGVIGVGDAGLFDALGWSYLVALVVTFGYALLGETIIEDLVKSALVTLISAALFAVTDGGSWREAWPAMVIGLWYATLLRRL